MMRRLVLNRSASQKWKSANTWLTDMINISIESFKLILNEINQIENKNSFIIIIIREDALLSKGESNEEMARQDHLHLCDTDSENTSLLVNNSNISLLFPPDTFMVITFAGALWQALLRVFEAELFSCADSSLCCCGTLNTVETLLTVAAAHLVLFPPTRQFFSSIIDGCLKYKNKEKPKTGPRPDPRLNYDVKISPIEAQLGPVGAGLKFRALAFPSVEITFLPRGPPSIVGPLESSWLPSPLRRPCLHALVSLSLSLSLSFTGKTVNECRLVLHAVATAVCQQYLVFLYLLNTSPKCCFLKTTWTNGRKNRRNRERNYRNKVYRWRNT